MRSLGKRRYRAHCDELKRLCRSPGSFVRKHRSFNLKNSFSLRNRRIESITRVLKINAFRFFVITRSKYRALYFASISWRPCHFSGSGRKAFESKIKSFTSKVSSPCLVIKFAFGAEESRRHRFSQRFVPVLSQYILHKTDLDFAGKIPEDGQTKTPVRPQSTNLPAILKVFFGFL